MTHRTQSNRRRLLAAEGFRVVLTGFDADPLLRETPATYFSALRREDRKSTRLNSSHT